MKILKTVSGIVITAVMLDAFILFASLAQIGIEGRTGEWNSFWKWQAEQVIRVLE